MNEYISREEHLDSQGKLPPETTCHRTYSVDVNYFKRWSHDMAYILGFTATNGCIRVDNSPVREENGEIVSYKGIYQVTWSVPDICVLEYIKAQLSAEHPITKRPAEYYAKYTYQHARDQWYLTVSNKEIVTDLCLLGILPRTSKIVTVPSDYPLEYMSSYIRGVWDGDGCWSLDVSHKRPHPRAFLTSGSKEFLVRIGDILRNEIGIVPKIYTTKNGVYTLSYGGPEVAALAHYIDPGNRFMIARKQAKMHEVTRGYEPKVCSTCGKPFIKVATLTMHCKKCKVQDIVRPVSQEAANIRA